ncbi:MAG: ureidoglycolate lyase [Sphingomonadales bacterium]|nr:ureidoglycolate lyase [Sphingomonadales bacterium]
MNVQTAVKPEIKTLPLQIATPEKLAPYGEVLGYNPDVAPMPIDFYDGAAKVRRVADFVSDDQTEMPVVTVNRRPFEMRYVERHFKHTQAFISLGSKPFIAAFAPPNNDAELPDMDAFEAFLFDGSVGFMMHIGTWHDFPYAVFDNTNLLVILRKEATDGLVRDNVIQDEAESPDLEKRDLLARRNTLIRFEL